MLIRRAQLKRLLRAELDARGWLEIDAPALIASGDFEPNIALFRAHLANGTPAGALHSSPELMIKRLLCAYPDLPGTYYLGPVFRAGEAGARHNPEFTMLEWYETGADLQAAIATALALIESARRQARLPVVPVRHRGYGTLFREQLDLDPYHADTSVLDRAASDHGIDMAATQGMSRDDWLDLLMSTVIEPTFPTDTLTVVTGYPASQAAMARLAETRFEGHNVRVAERFEVYGGRLEMANGYHELTDAAEQSRRLGGQSLATADATQRHFLDALGHGLPDCSGVALGVDRLLMWLSGESDIDAVLPFSARRV